MTLAFEQLRSLANEYRRLRDASDGLEEAATHLCLRVVSWSENHLDDESVRDWVSHVDPAVARLKEALASHRSVRQPDAEFARTRMISALRQIELSTDTKEQGAIASAVLAWVSAQ